MLKIIGWLAWTVNSEHTKFSLKCIICNLSSYRNWSSLQITFHCWSDFLEGADCERNSKLEIKPAVVKLHVARWLGKNHITAKTVAMERKELKDTFCFEFGRGLLAVEIRGQLKAPPPSIPLSPAVVVTSHVVMYSCCTVILLKALYSHPPHATRPGLFPGASVQWNLHHWLSGPSDFPDIYLKPNVRLIRADWPLNVMATPLYSSSPVSIFLVEGVRIMEVSQWRFHCTSLRD